MFSLSAAGYGYLPQTGPQCLYDDDDRDKLLQVERTFNLKLMTLDVTRNSIASFIK